MSMVFGPGSFGLFELLSQHRNSWEAFEAFILLDKFGSSTNKYHVLWTKHPDR